MIHDFLSDLRKERGITQDYLAKKLGLTRQTYAQIEKGERDLTIKEAEQIAGIFGITLQDFLQGNTREEPVVKMGRASKKQSHITVSADKVEKFKQVLLYILQMVGARPNIGETALYKILYFIDFDYFEEYKEKLTGATYIKNIHGPTPVAFKQIVDEMIRDGGLEVVKSKYFQYEQRKYLPKKDPDLTAINAREIKFIDKEVSLLAEKNAKDLSDYSHGDAPWLFTEDGEVIDYRLVWERTAPYTKHDYDMEFLQAGANDVLKDLGPISKEEYEYYMNLPDNRETR
jgi:transcriptional regulator with XRE-family HTH domain